MAELTFKQKVRPESKMLVKGSLGKLNSMKQQLPPSTSKTKVGAVESMTSVVSKTNLKLDENEVPIAVVLEGAADLTSEDGLTASGIETLIAGATANVDEASHQIRYVKSVAGTGKIYLPTFAGVIYALLITLTLADASSFDSQELKLYTLNSDGSDEETYNLLVQPKTRNVKILLLSSREINGERVLFPSKAAGKTIPDSDVKHTVVIEGSNCSATCIVATPRDLGKLL